MISRHFCNRFQKLQPHSFFLKIKLHSCAASTSHHVNFHSSSQRKYFEDKQNKELTVIGNVKQVKNSPKAALTLGFGGLIPFVAAPAYMISYGIYFPLIDYAQLAYGASILSFIGGVRWGLTLPEGSTQGADWHNLCYSVLPSLIAWGGLLVNPTLGSFTIMSGLALTGYMDIFMWGYPNWYKGMRFCLTFIAILSLWTSVMCKYILAKQDSAKNSVNNIKPVIS